MRNYTPEERQRQLAKVLAELVVSNGFEMTVKANAGNRPHVIQMILEIRAKLDAFVAQNYPGTPD